MIDSVSSLARGVCVGIVFLAAAGCGQHLVDTTNRTTGPFELPITAGGADCRGAGQALTIGIVNLPRNRICQHSGTTPPVTCVSGALQDLIYSFETEKGEFFYLTDNARDPATTNNVPYSVRFDRVDGADGEIVCDSYTAGAMDVNGKKVWGVKCVGRIPSPGDRQFQAFINRPSGGGVCYVTNPHIIIRD